MKNHTLKHFHVSYKTTSWAGKKVMYATKVYAEDAEMAKKKVLALHPAIFDVIQSYDLGD